MAERKITAAKIFERNAKLTFRLMRYLIKRPEVLEHLPDNFELIILSDDDPQLTAYNLGLLQKYGSEGRPVVFVRMAFSRAASLKKARPQVYTPLAV